MCGMQSNLKRGRLKQEMMSKKITTQVRYWMSLSVIYRTKTSIKKSKRNKQRSISYTTVNGKRDATRIHNIFMMT